VRSGQSEAEICWIYSQPGVWVREKRDLLRALMWSCILPITIVVGTIFFRPAALVGILLYPLQICQIALFKAPKSANVWTYAFFMMLVKFAQFQGNLKFYWRRWSGRSIELIEYKQSPTQN